jgi:hypothetical protein
MDRALFLFRYIWWHYTSAFKEILALWLNFAWFVTHFFSMPTLLRTLFSPWKRMSDTYQRRGLTYLAETFVFNTFSRVFGACIRTVLLFLGVLALCILVLALIPSLIIWIVLPFISLLFITFGASLLIV